MPGEGNAKCPFFIRAEPPLCRVSCESFGEDAVCEMLKFRSKEAFRHFFHEFCCEKYRDCLRYKGLTALKYDGF